MLSFCWWGDSGDLDGRPRVAFSVLSGMHSNQSRTRSDSITESLSIKLVECRNGH